MAAEKRKLQYAERDILSEWRSKKGTQKNDQCNRAGL